MYYFKDCLSISFWGSLSRLMVVLYISSLYLFSQNVFAQTNNNLKDGNATPCSVYIKSKGENTIIFDHTNIKQYWISNSVCSQAGAINISLISNNNLFESDPLKVQFINVNELQDCTIDIIAEEIDFDLEVLNNNLQSISTTSNTFFFGDYYVLSVTVHLEDTAENSLFLKFTSKDSDFLSINKLVFSFTNNPSSHFYCSPGKIHISFYDVLDDLKKDISNDDTMLYSVTGVYTRIISKNKILISDDSKLSNFVKVKNIGDTPTHVYFGYAPYAKNGMLIDHRVIPYKNINKVLTVVSHEKSSNKIEVDSYSEWEKGCHLVLNATDDLSDFPNFTCIDSKIIDVKRLENNHAVIFFEKPVNNPSIKAGTKVRIHSIHGSTFLYTNEKILQPGEESSFSSTISKDNSFFEFSSKALCKGTYYVIPIILSYSLDRSKENTVLIKDFNVSF